MREFRTVAGACVVLLAAPAIAEDLTPESPLKDAAKKMKSRG